MVDEYIRLDTTIMGIDGLINEAPTGSQARALLCAKDMIYDQQRYVSEMKPVKRGRWVTVRVDGDSETICNNCYENTIMRTDFCPHCGADMRGDTNG